MTQQHNTTQSTQASSLPTRFAHTHYGLLGLHPSASGIEIRRAYRELSKRYHPDTTELPQQEATAKFQRLNQAYATLSNPEKRSLYDLQIGYSRVNVIQVPSYHPTKPTQASQSAYLDPSDRPLSAGEIFALFILGLTLVGCFVLVIAIALVRGDEVFPVTALPYKSLPLESSVIGGEPLATPDTINLKY